MFLEPWFHIVQGSIMTNWQHIHVKKLTIFNIRQKKIIQKCEKKAIITDVFFFFFQICEVGGYEINLKETLPNLPKN